MVVLDAFSSDAIPVHLLTAEAVQEYLAHLTTDGVLAVHISNRFFDLAPVVSRLADDLGLTGLRRNDAAAGVQESGRWSSQWVVLAADPSAVTALTPELGWGALPAPEGRLWTDDYSDLLGAFEL